MNRDYFIRWKSAISGPFNLDEIKGLLKSGKISKHHQVSSDKLQWVPLRDSVEFKSECSVVPIAAAQPSPHQTDDTSRTVASEPARDAADAKRPVLRIRDSSNLARNDDQEIIAHKSENADRDSVSASERWYYSDEGQVLGPVDFTELSELVNSGTLRRNSPVCRDGDEAWHKAEDAFPSLWTGKPRLKIANKPEYQQDGDAYGNRHTQTSSLAIWSLVLSLLGFGLPAVICGHIGLSKIRSSRGRLTGEGMCIAGLIIGYITMLIFFGIGFIGGFIEGFINAL